MPNKKKLGGECIAYRNTGTYGTPVWNAIDDLSDVNLPMSKGAGEFKTRGSKFVLKKGGKIETGWGGKLVYDTGSDDWSVLRDGFLNGTAIEFAIMDGAIAATGSQGLRAACEIFEMPIDEPLEEGVTVDITASPTISDNEPAWMTVT